MIPSSHHSLRVVSRRSRNIALNGVDRDQRDRREHGDWNAAGRRASLRVAGRDSNRIAPKSRGGGNGKRVAVRAVVGSRIAVRAIVVEWLRRASAVSAQVRRHRNACGRGACSGRDFHGKQRGRVLIDRGWISCAGWRTFRSRWATATHGVARELLVRGSAGVAGTAVNRPPRSGRYQCIHRPRGCPPRWWKERGRRWNPQSNSRSFRSRRSRRWSSRWSRRSVRSGGKSGGGVGEIDLARPIPLASIIALTVRSGVLGNAVPLDPAVPATRNLWPGCNVKLGSTKTLPELTEVPAAEAYCSA